MSTVRSLRKLAKSLNNYSKILYSDKDYEIFDEKSKKVIKIFKKYLKITRTHGEKIQIEALINRLVTLRASVNNVMKNNDISVKKGARAFEKRISTTLFINHKYKNFEDFFCASKRDVIRLLRRRLKKFNCIKIGAILVAKFKIRDVIETKYIYEPAILISRKSNLKKFYDEKIVPNIKNSLETFQANGSTPQLVKILNLTINVNKCNPLRAGTYIDLPKFIKTRRAVKNIKNYDNICFLWCLFFKFYPNHRFIRSLDHHPLSKMKHKKAFGIFKKHFKNLEKFSFSMPLKSVPKFERENEVSINVFVIDDKNKILPVLITEKKQKLHANLLLIEKNGSYHYCLINNLPRLLGSQVTKKREVFLYVNGV